MRFRDFGPAPGARWRRPRTYTAGVFWHTAGSFLRHRSRPVHVGDPKRGLVIGDCPAGVTGMAIAGASDGPSRHPGRSVSIRAQRRQGEHTLTSAGRGRSCGALPQHALRLRWAAGRATPLTLPPDPALAPRVRTGHRSCTATQRFRRDVFRYIARRGSQRVYCCVENCSRNTHVHVGWVRARPQRWSQPWS